MRYNSSSVYISTLHLWLLNVTRRFVPQLQKNITFYCDSKKLSHKLQTAEGAVICQLQQNYSYKRETQRWDISLHRVTNTVFANINVCFWKKNMHTSLEPTTYYLQKHLFPPVQHLFCIPYHSHLYQTNISEQFCHISKMYLLNVMKKHLQKQKNSFSYFGCWS